MQHLYPIESETRELKSLDGIWALTMDRDGTGTSRGWFNGLPGDAMPMPVPSSYNDVTTDAALRDHVGDVWYECNFWLPEAWRDRDVFIRFGSATHHAMVWLNGVEIVSHKGGFLPFAGQVNAAGKFGQTNRLIVRLNNILDWTTLPPGEVECGTRPDGSVYRKQNYFHDFFNYAGIHRSVVLCSLPRRRVETIETRSEINGGAATLFYNAGCNLPGEVRVRLLDETGQAVATGSGNDGALVIENPHLWQPLNAYLYTLEITAHTGGKIDDIYRQPVGLRTVKVQGSAFLINNEPFYFRGYGWHEDSNLRGKGFDAVTLVRDVNLMRWSGANSLRTSHYPYTEETLRMADRLGLVVISEAPGVGLFDHRPGVIFCDEKASEALQRHHLDTVRDLIARDRNHPCVVMWSVGNETLNNDPHAYDYFAPIFAEARKLDPSRPVTIVDHMEPETDTLLSLSDVICINKYHGWYDHCGEIEQVESLFLDTLRRFHEAAGDKPIIISEHGVDTLPGSRELPSTLFNEDYQVQWLECVHRALDQCDYVIGEHVWVLADFATKQSIHRVNGNRKGVFTRDRHPKQAAYYLKKRWGGLNPGERPHANYN